MWGTRGALVLGLLLVGLMSMTVQVWTAQLTPVLMVPGIAGSGLYVSLNQTNLPNCTQNYTYPQFRMWASYKEMLPYYRGCWISMMTLQYSTGSPLGHYYAPAGVNVTVHDFGGTKGFEYLDYVEGYGAPGTEYMGEIVYGLQKLGYTSENLIGFPFDWRYPPDQLNWNDMKTLVETTVQKAGKKIIIIAHSLGTVYTNFFLNTRVDAKWKQQYVDRFIVIGGVFGGSVKGIKALLSGYNDAVSMDFWNVINVSLIPAKLIRDMHRSFGSIYAVLPRPEVYGAEFPVVKMEQTAKSSPGLLARLSDWLFGGATPQSEDAQGASSYSLANWTTIPGLDDQYKQKVRDALARLTPDAALKDPEVPVVCVWGNFDKETTDVGYMYGAKGIEEAPAIIYGKGDGTIPLQSLKHCTSWSSLVLSREFPNLDHMYMLKDPSLVQFISSQVQSQINRRGGPPPPPRTFPSSQASETVTPLRGKREPEDVWDDEDPMEDVEVLAV